jgi:hypothetical protein
MKYYSQFEEDKYIIEKLKISKKGFFVDIGAGTGLNGSNTKAFENLGWDGICFEPNEINYQKCKSHRKRVYKIAVSSKEEKQFRSARFIRFEKEKR